MRMLELCAGIGAMSYVWRDVLGQEIAGQVEIDPFCQAVLAKHFPNVKRMGDIREVKGHEFGRVDLVAGGIPCQPFSVAGKRRGTADDRHLWPEMLRIIDATHCPWVLVENVAGFVAVVLDDVCADLERRGYEARAFVLPASAVGAPHLRERCFLVAHANGGADKSHGRKRRGRTRAVPAQFGAEVLRPQDGAIPANRSAHLALRPRTRVGQGESRVGGSLDGLPAWLDGHRWPAGPSQAQHEWEASRTYAGRTTNRTPRLKALGNAIVPQQVAPILAAIAITAGA